MKRILTLILLLTTDAELLTMVALFILCTLLFAIHTRQLRHIMPK